MVLQVGEQIVLTAVFKMFFLKAKGTQIWIVLNPQMVNDRTGCSMIRMLNMT